MPGCSGSHALKKLQESSAGESSSQAAYDSERRQQGSAEPAHGSTGSWGAPSGEGAWRPVGGEGGEAAVVLGAGGSGAGQVFT